MKKIIIFLLVFLFSLTSCGNSTIQNVFENNSKENVINNLSSVVRNIQMFPNKENENELVNYAFSICQNIDMFNYYELDDIYNKLNFNYSFEYNDKNYTKSDYDKCLNNLKDKMNVLSKKG